MNAAIQNAHTRRNFRKKVIKAIFSLTLIFTLTLVVPVGFLHVYAAPLEDCDLDGFDDATGVPVPWPGYDETKGDTPAGPGGQTSSAASSKASSAPASSASSAPASSASSAPASSAGNAASSKPSSAASSKPSGTTSGNAISSAPSQASEQSAASQSESQAAVSAAASDVESVVNTKGSLKITETNGSIIHAGSSVKVSGTGFTGNVDDLEIVIHSEPRILGTVASAENGSFETQISIPKDLAAGTHTIVVSYQGREIMSQQIKIGPKAADSFLQALSVGFTKDNKDFIPGVSVLTGLLALGLAVLLVNVFARFRRSKNLS